MPGIYWCLWPDALANHLLGLLSFGEMCCTLTKRWAIITIVYASHSLAKGICRVIENNLARFILHLPWKRIHIECLYAQRPVIVKVTKQQELSSNFSFVSYLCYRRNSAPSPCNTCVRLLWWLKMIVLVSFPRRWCLKSSEFCPYCWVCSLPWLYLPACACTHGERLLQFTDWRKLEGLFLWNGRRDRTFCSASFLINFDPFQQPLLVIVLHQCSLVPKMKFILFPIMGPVHLKTHMKGCRLKLFSSR